MLTLDLPHDLSFLRTGIQVVTMAPPLGQLDRSALSLASAALAFSPAVRLSLVALGDEGVAVFRDALSSAVGPGRWQDLSRVIHLRGLDRLALFPATSAYFSSFLAPHLDDGRAAALALGLQVFDPASPCDLLSYVGRRAGVVADAARAASAFQWEAPIDPWRLVGIGGDEGGAPRDRPAGQPGGTDLPGAAHRSCVWALGPTPAEAGFDLGAGAGRVERVLAPKVREIHLVDPAAARLDEARGRLAGHANVFFHRNNGYDLLPLPSSYFDFGFADLVFGHVPAAVVEGYVAEAWRVLKPGGRFAADIPGEERLVAPDLAGRTIAGIKEPAARALFGRFSRVDVLDGGTDLLIVAVK